MNEYFKKAGDLNENNDNTYDEISSEEKIIEYLSNFASGKRYNYESELGTICSEGIYIVSFEDLQKMIDDGSYNFVKINYFNEQMIEIEFQQFEKNYTNKL